MRRTTTILSALAVAAGVWGAGSAMAMDGYYYQPRATYYYDSNYAPLGSYHGTYEYPDWRYRTTYQDAPDSGYNYAPLGSYYGTYQYGPDWGYRSTYLYAPDRRYRTTYQYAPHWGYNTYQYAPYGGYYGGSTLHYQRRGQGYDNYIGR